MNSAVNTVRLGYKAKSVNALYKNILFSEIHKNKFTLWAEYKAKGKGHPITGHEVPEGEQMYSSTLPSTSALDRGGRSTPRPGRFTPRKDPVPIVQEAGWAPGPVWTGAENLAPQQDSIPGPSDPFRVAIPTELSRPTYDNYHTASVLLTLLVSQFTSVLTAANWHSSTATLRVKPLPSLQQQNKGLITNYVEKNYYKMLTFLYADLTSHGC